MFQNRTRSPYCGNAFKAHAVSTTRLRIPRFMLRFRYVRGPVCTENLIRVDDLTKSTNLAS
jgi:hypothetical protein